MKFNGLIRTCMNYHYTGIYSLTCYCHWHWERKKRNCCNEKIISKRGEDMRKIKGLALANLGSFTTVWQWQTQKSWHKTWVHIVSPQFHNGQRKLYFFPHGTSEVNHAVSKMLIVHRDVLVGNHSFTREQCLSCLSFIASARIISFFVCVYPDHVTL